MAKRGKLNQVKSWAKLTHKKGHSKEDIHTQLLDRKYSTDDARKIVESIRIQNGAKILKGNSKKVLAIALVCLLVLLGSYIALKPGKLEKHFLTLPKNNSIPPNFIGPIIAINPIEGSPDLELISEFAGEVVKTRLILSPINPYDPMGIPTIVALSREKDLKMWDSDLSRPIMSLGYLANFSRAQLNELIVVDEKALIEMFRGDKFGQVKKDDMGRLVVMYIIIHKPNWDEHEFKNRLNMDWVQYG